jgi:hypothetical protein
MNTFGFIYVCACNLNLESGTCFHSLHSTISDFHQTIAFSPIFFLLSTVIVLRGEHDLAGIDGPLEKFDQDENNTRTWQEFYDYNQYCWFSGFLLGLQMTHADVGVM